MGRVRAPARWFRTPPPPPGRPRRSLVFSTHSFTPSILSISRVSMHDWLKRIKSVRALPTRRAKPFRGCQIRNVESDRSVVILTTDLSDPTDPTDPLSNLSDSYTFAHSYTIRKKKVSPNQIPIPNHIFGSNHIFPPNQFLDCDPKSDFPAKSDFVAKSDFPAKSDLPAKSESGFRCQIRFSGQIGSQSLSLPSL